MIKNTKQAKALVKTDVSRRLLKFRVWDFIDKEMTSFENIRILPSEDMFYQLFEEDRYRWLQFTGLKDSKRKDIYEGDITENGYVIQWNSLHNCWGYFSKKGYKKEILSEIHTPTGRLTDCHIPEKIIGNIFQNPSLLQSAS